MADKTAQQKDVESTAEEVVKTKSEEATTPAENGEKTEENGKEDEEDKVEAEEGKKDPEDDKKVEDDETDKVCSIKRKSTGGDAPSETPAEGATPEKKAKLDETAEPESNGEAEVAA